jgi:lysophospholipase
VTAPALALSYSFVDVAGVRIRLALAPPPEARPARSLILLNGRTEFAEKYVPAITDLRARGFHVATLDWRGQGASDRLLADRVRGHVVDFRHFQDDLDALARLADGQLARPWYGFAHSMGGLIMMERLVAEPDFVRKAVLSAPFLGLPVPVWQLRAMGPLVRLARDLGLGGRYLPGRGPQAVDPELLRADQLTSDLERFEAYRAIAREVPDRILGAATIGWVAAALDAFARLERPGALEGVTTPLLMLLAGDEQIVSPTAAELVAKRLPDARTVDFPEAGHELLWEKEATRSRVLDEIDRFLA